MRLREDELVARGLAPGLPVFFALRGDGVGDAELGDALQLCGVGSGERGQRASGKRVWRTFVGQHTCIWV